jgi:glyoxylase-like metal-dependent hydrolase (beta-lactamase superfamily II)
MLEVRRIVNHIFTSNTYLLYDECYSYCWLIDIGDFDRVADAVPEEVQVRGVFLTHTHFDHIYGINALHRAYPECRVYTTEYGVVALYDEKKNFSKYHELPFVYEGTEVIVLNDDESIELYPEISMKVYATPGHCPSCLTYIVGNWVFTGDSYIPDVKVVTKLPGGDRILAKQSLDKILKLTEGKVVCAGHGEEIKMIL